jgi:hypothetical protein
VSCVTRRRRHTIAAAVAVVVHAAVVLHILAARPLPLHSYVKGAVAPAYLHMTVVESAHKGAVVAPSRVPLAPKDRFFGDELVGEPERPRLALWVLNAPLESRSRDDDVADAGPE